jgi:hypothetical protein
MHVSIGGIGHSHCPGSICWALWVSAQRGHKLCIIAGEPTFLSQDVNKVSSASADGVHQRRLGVGAERGHELCVVTGLGFALGSRAISPLPSTSGAVHHIRIGISAELRHHVSIVITSA